MNIKELKELIDKEHEAIYTTKVELEEKLKRLQYNKMHEINELVIKLNVKVNTYLLLNEQYLIEEHEKALLNTVKTAKSMLKDQY